MFFDPRFDPFPNTKYLPSLLPCRMQVGAHPPRHGMLLRKENGILEAIVKESDTPLPLCQFMADYYKTVAPGAQMQTFNELLGYITLPPRSESLATILGTFPIERIRRLDIPPSEEAMPTVPPSVRAAEQDRLKALIKDGIMKQVFIPYESYSKRAYLKPNGTFTFLYDGDGSWHSSELLWYFKKEFEAPLKLLQPLVDTDYALGHIYFHDRPGNSLATLCPAATAVPKQPAVVPCTAVVQPSTTATAVVQPSTTAAVVQPNPNVILNVANAKAILDRLKAKNAELQAHFDLLTEADALKERNRFMEASIRQLMAKMDE